MKTLSFGLLAAVCGFAQINVPLTVREALYPGSMSGVARTNEPLTVGVPLPDSAGIKSTATLGLTGATAGQFSVEGKWPDGNIKWLKVRAIVPSVNAGGTATMTLTNSGGGNFGGSNLATDNGPTIAVATGTATFTIKKANFNVVDQVVVGSTTVIASGKSEGLVIIGPDPTQAYPANVTCLPTAGGSPCATVYASANDPNSTAVIEENGPAVAVIKATGSHLDARGNTYMHFTARLFFYKNKNYVKVTSSLRNADHGGSNTFQTAFKGFQAYEIRVSPNITGTLNYTIANDTGTATTGTLNAPGGTDYAYIYQAESNLMKSPVWCGVYGCIPYTSISGYSIIKNGSTVLTGTPSQYPAGWADVSDSSGVGVEIGQYQFAAYGNKSLEFRNGGTDMRIGLWAAENNTTSTSTLIANYPYYAVWPQINIQDAYLNFHGTTQTAAALSGTFLSYQHYLLASAATSYYNSTNVFTYPLLDPTEETTYYNNMATSALPSSVSLPANSDLSATSNTLNIWRFWAWEAGGGGNQMDARIGHIYNFIRKGFTGSYLDSVHWYKMAVENAYPWSDGFDWRSYPGELGSSTQPTQTSANSSLAGRNWETQYEHPHSYGLPEAYFITGDEFFKDALLDSFKEHWLNGSGNVVVGGSLWNARAVGNSIKWEVRLDSFLAAVGDPEAGTGLSRATTIYTNQVRPTLCVSGWGGGSACTLSPPSRIGGTPGSPGHGISRERGNHYEWEETIGSDPSCSVSAAADAGPFQTSMYLEGLWELRKAQGSSWPYYTESFDLAYGVANWALNEMYYDNGNGQWGTNGYRHYEMIDYANNCNGSQDWGVTAEQTVWYEFFILHQYTGATNWQQKFNMVLQRDTAVTATDEFYNFTIGNLIYLLNHPIGQTLQTIPLTNFVANGGGSYTLSWAVPSGAQSYRIKWGPKQIVDWIGFDAGSNTFLGNPVTTQNWFASTDAGNIPAPSGSSQSLTITTGVSGLSAANFMIKAYVGSPGTSTGTGSTGTGSTGTGTGGTGSGATSTTPPPSACDLNDDGVVNASDVLLAVNQALGVSPCTTADLLQTGQCNVVDVQRVINASLGGACLTGTGSTTGTGTGTGTVTGTGVPDTTPPTVSITAPQAGATLSGIVTISANASDQVAVASVQFQLDGNNLGNPLTVAGPVYSLSWDTTTTVDGNHTLSALATDTSGNTKLSAPVSITVKNGTSVTAGPFSIGWTSLSNTTLKSVCPPSTSSYSFAFNCQYAISAWSGGIADTKRNRLIIWGGGHNDYYGNEVYALNLNSNPITLTRLNNPSPINSNPALCIAALSDGNPNSRHTYAGLAYMSNLDKMFAFGGSVACDPGQHLEDLWTLDLSTLQWQRMDPVTGSQQPNTFYTPVPNIAAYDPNTTSVFLSDTTQLWKYDYGTNKYTFLNGSASVPYNSTGVIDPKRKLFIIAGDDTVGGAGRMSVIDVSSGSNYAVQPWTVTGCAGLLNSEAPGLAYDSALDRIVGWPNFGNTIYIFDPDTKSCTSQTFAGGPPNSVDYNGNAATTGTFGRFQYFPALNIFAVVNFWTNNAYVLRLN